MDASNGASAPVPNAAMARALEDSWDRVVTTMGETADPEIIKLLRKVFWLGVTSGVQVFNDAIEGKYGRPQT
jgi:hypothetical protein